MSDIVLSEAAGCTYTERKGTPPCNKMCDPEQTLCPYHLLIVKAKADAKKPVAKEPPPRSHRTPRGYEA